MRKITARTASRSRTAADQSSSFGVNSSGNTVVVLQDYLDAGGPGFSIRGYGPSYTLSDAGYHTYDLVFNPQTQM